MVRFIFVALLLVGVSGAQNNFNISPKAPAADSTPQKDIETREDYNEFISVLKEAISMGDKMRSAYYLGTVYLTDFNLSNGENIPKDVERAEKYFKMALDEGNYMSSYNLAMIYASKKEIGKALFAIDLSLEKMKMTKNENLPLERFLSSVFASITLEYRADDKEAVSHAITLLLPFATRGKPTILFMLANLFKIQKQDEKANSLLNTACTSDSSIMDYRLRQICSNFKTSGKGATK